MRNITDINSKCYFKNVFGRPFLGCEQSYLWLMTFGELV
jgi:hypothetical protein